MSDTSPGVLQKIWVAMVVLVVVFLGQVDAQTVKLTWNSNPAPNIAGYLVFYGVNTNNLDRQIDVGTTNSASIDGLQPGVPYYFEVAAYDTNRVESPPSESVSYTIPVLTWNVVVSSDLTNSGNTSGGGVYADASLVTVTATPESGYVFVNWTENGTPVSDSSSYSFVIGANHNLVANFAAATLTFTVSENAGDNGSVSPSGPQTVSAGGAVTFTAATSSGFQVGAWLVNGVVAQTGGSIFTLQDVNTNSVVAVNFTTDPTVAVAASPAGAGSVAGGGAYPPGSSVTVTATANKGYTFTNWTESGVVQSALATYNLVLTGNRNLVANFTANPVSYTLTASAGDNGNVSPTGPLGVAAGGSMTFNATPATGYQVNQWFVGGVPAQTGGSTFTLSDVTSNSVVTVTFTMEPTVSVTANPSNGGGVTGGGAYISGASVTVTAAANKGFTFSNWTENGVVQRALTSYNFVLMANRNLVANFAANPTYRVIANAGINGSVTPAAPQTVDAGGAMTFTAKPSNGYQVNQWFVGGVAARSGGLEFALPVVTSNTTVAVTFSDAVTNFTVQVKGQGSVSGYRSGQVVHTGKKYSIVAVAAKGSLFADWASNGVMVASSPNYTFMAESNLLLQASFVTNPFIPVEGVYHGLFYDTNEAAEESSGSFVADVTSSGAFSARIEVGSVAYSRSAKFSLTGAALISIPRGKLSPITVQLQLGLSSGLITGTISDGKWSANLTAQPNIYFATNHAPEAGRYTMVIPGSSNPGEPAGNGFVAVTVGVLGNVTLSGILGDGTPVYSTSVVGGQGEWPLYISLYGGQGSIFGWLNFTNGGNIGGSVAWFKLPQPKARFYSGGFSTIAEVVGSPYRVVKGVSPFNVVADQISLTGGNLAQSFGIQLGTDALLLGVAPGLDKLAFSPSSGVFRVTVFNPLTDQKMVVGGIVLQSQNYGAGLFLGANQTGSAILAPGQ